MYKHNLVVELKGGEKTKLHFMDVESVTSIANTHTSHLILSKKQIGWDSHAPLYIADRSPNMRIEKKKK